MQFRIVSHACLDIKARGKRLVIDPWLNEPAYWSAWWHAPPPIFEADIFDADYVYVTHWHFDHFDPKTLKKFSKNTTVMVPRFPISGLHEQLRDIGFARIIELEHGRPIQLADGADVHQLPNQLPRRQRRGRRSRRHGPGRSQRRKTAAVVVA